MIELLGQYNREDAIAWALARLDCHEGLGECTGSTWDDGLSPASKAEAERALVEAIANITNTPAEKYLREVRRIEPPFPDGVKWWPDARTGEGAILFELTWNGRIVGCQAGYLDPVGNKSTVLPNRRKLMLERAPGAHFLIPASSSNAETIAALGIEDALAIKRYLRRATPVRVLGLPGDAALRHLRINKGEILTVCRDADISNPAADLAIADGLDSLLLQSGNVPDWATTPNPGSIFVTNTTAHGKDASQVLLDKGVDGLNVLLEDIEKATLSSPKGVIWWLAGLDRIDLDLEIKRASRATGLRIPTLRAEVDDWKKRARVHDPEEPEPVPPDEDVDIAAVLDALLEEMRRYIVAPVTVLGTASLWTVFTHLVHSERLLVPVAPRLGIQARTPGCGKTLLLEVLNSVVFNPRATASITTSTILRTLGKVKPTMLIDEAQRLLRANDKSELISVLNAGHYRWNAFVERSVQMPNGDWEVERFPVWGTMVLASIGELPQEQQERAIVINLRKALAKDVPTRLRHGTSAELQRLQNAIAGWAAAIDELPEVGTPDALKYQAGRIFDNWEPLIQIATLAGGRWPELVHTAIMAAINIEREPTPAERVLAGIKKAFDAVEARTREGVDRLRTTELLAEMLGDTEAEWDREYNGRPITSYWLRTVLRGLLEPPGAKDWWEPEGKPRQQQRKVSGYYKSQFTRAWEVYLGEVGAGSTNSSGTDDRDEYAFSGSKPSGTSGSSKPTGTDGGNTGVFKGDICPLSTDGVSSGPIKVSQKVVENCGPVPGEADEPDVPDLARVLSVHLSGGPRPQPNGEDYTRWQPHGAFAKAIREYAALNPDLSSARIAKHFGCPRQRVNRALGKEDKAL
jgi:hypothetical protein